MIRRIVSPLAFALVLAIPLVFGVELNEREWMTARGNLVPSLDYSFLDVVNSNLQEEPLDAFIKSIQSLESGMDAKKSSPSEAVTKLRRISDDVNRQLQVVHNLASKLDERMKSVEALDEQMSSTSDEVEHARLWFETKQQIVASFSTIQQNLAQLKQSIGDLRPLMPELKASAESTERQLSSKYIKLLAQLLLSPDSQHICQSVAKFLGKDAGAVDFNNPATLERIKDYLSTTNLTVQSLKADNVDTSTLNGKQAALLSFLGGGGGADDAPAAAAQQAVPEETKPAAEATSPSTATSSTEANTDTAAIEQNAEVVTGGAALNEETAEDSQIADQTRRKRRHHQKQPYWAN